VSAGLNCLAFVVVDKHAIAIVAETSLVATVVWVAESLGVFWALVLDARVNDFAQPTADIWWAMAEHTVLILNTFTTVLTNVRSAILRNQPLALLAGAARRTVAAVGVVAVWKLLKVRRHASTVVLTRVTAIRVTVARHVTCARVCSQFDDAGLVVVSIARFSLLIAFSLAETFFLRGNQRSSDSHQQANN
jgi:hypothetical protein